jgi:hypothetical protein
MKAEETDLPSGVRNGVLKGMYKNTGATAVVEWLSHRSHYVVVTDAVHVRSFADVQKICFVVVVVVVVVESCALSRLGFDEWIAVKT